jgi:hypothetical protein
MRKYKQETIWQEIEQGLNNLVRLNTIEMTQYDPIRHEMRRSFRTAMERIEAREKHERKQRSTQIHNDKNAL